MVKYSEVLNHKMKVIEAELKDMIRLAIDRAGFKSYRAVKDGYKVQEEFFIVDIEIRLSEDYCFIVYNPRILDIPITPMLTYFSYNYERVKDLVESLKKFEKLINLIQYNEDINIKLRDLRLTIKGIK